MSCCTTDGTEKFFTKSSKRFTKQFRKKGLDKPSKLIADRLVELGVDSKSILDIGCGVGGLHLTLLKHGAASAQGVEISEGMIASARAFAREMGFERKVEYFQADFVSANGEIGPSDIVILDKVICCYPAVADLLGKSTMNARELYALSYPRDALLAKLVFKTMQWFGQLLRWSFHPYYHDPIGVDETIERSGFGQVFSGTTVLWQVKIFRRV